MARSTLNGFRFRTLTGFAIQIRTSARCRRWIWDGGREGTGLNRKVRQLWLTTSPRPLTIA